MGCPRCENPTGLKPCADMDSETSPGLLLKSGAIPSLIILSCQVERAQLAWARSCRRKDGIMAAPATVED